TVDGRQEPGQSDRPDPRCGNDARPPKSPTGRRHRPVGRRRRPRGGRRPDHAGRIGRRRPACRGPRNRTADLATRLTRRTVMSTELEFIGARRRRIIIAASAGNFAEWYDWGVYGVVATIIAAKFFPEGNPTAALLNTYAVFAAGYIARPLGGILFGWIADRYGRRRALSISILLTCGGTALMGLLPTYAQIGLLAPALLLVCRLAQSMGAGGEYASAIS